MLGEVIESDVTTYVRTACSCCRTIQVNCGTLSKFSFPRKVNLPTVVQITKGEEIIMSKKQLDPVSQSLSNQTLIFAMQLISAKGVTKAPEIKHEASSLCEHSCSCSVKYTSSFLFNLGFDSFYLFSTLFTQQCQYDRQTHPRGKLKQGWQRQH